MIVETRFLAISHAPIISVFGVVMTSIFLKENIDKIPGGAESATVLSDLHELQNRFDNCPLVYDIGLKFQLML